MTSIYLPKAIKSPVSNQHFAVCSQTAVGRSSVIRTQWLSCCLLLSILGFSACNNDLTHLGMQAETGGELIEVADSDEESVANSKRLGWTIEDARRKICNLENQEIPSDRRRLEEFNEKARSLRRSIEELPEEKQQEYRRYQ